MHKQKKDNLKYNLHPWKEFLKILKKYYTGDSGNSDHLYKTLHIEQGTEFPDHCCTPFTAMDSEFWGCSGFL